MIYAPVKAIILLMAADNYSGIDKVNGKKGLLVRLRGLRSSLKKAEKKVAELLLKNPSEIEGMTVARLAGKSDVSEATVIRFCRSIGFDGFQEMKFQLARELTAPIHRIIQDQIKESDSAQSVMQKVISFNISTLKQTMEVLDERSLSSAANILSKAEKILIVGVGTSSANVQDAHNKFFRLGLNSVAQSDAHLQLMEAALLTARDVVLAVTHSGRTRDPVEALAAAKKAGAKTIVITSNAHSPITKYSDVVLLTSSSETRFRDEALASRVAQMSIIDVLYTLIGKKYRRRALAAAKKIESVVGQKQIMGKDF